MEAPASKESLLGTYLKDRRTKLDPVSLGAPMARRRTPGLRREEIAQRANISATWYTCLEQGRGGAPSADVLDRIARALMLTEVEREHLFMLGLGRPPEVRYKAVHGVAPRLQRVLDVLEYVPAYVKSPIWDVVAWNHAASKVLIDYGSLAAAQRNILRLVFFDPRVRAAHPDWESAARFEVAAFRADVTRAGGAKDVQEFVDRLCTESFEFDAMWRDQDVRSSFVDLIKYLQHPRLGQIALEYSAFSVDGRTDLNMVVYTPVTEQDAAKLKMLVDTQAGPIL